MLQVQVSLEHQLQTRAEPYLLTLNLPRGCEHESSPSSQATAQPSQAGRKPHTTSQAVPIDARPTCETGTCDPLALKSAEDLGNGASSANGMGTMLKDRSHRLQQWFCLDAFVTLAPASYSGRVMDEQASLQESISVCCHYAQRSWTP